MGSFHTKIAGIAAVEGRQKLVRRLYRDGELETGTELLAKREPDNPFDKNAIAIFSLDGEQLGFMRAAVAETIAPLMDQGSICKVFVEQVTGGDGNFNYGVNIRVEIQP